jgi:hypothetical protein
MTVTYADLKEWVLARGVVEDAWRRTAAKRVVKAYDSAQDQSD